MTVILDHLKIQKMKKILINSILVLILITTALTLLIFLDPFGYQGDQSYKPQDTVLTIEKGTVLVNNGQVPDETILKEGDVIEVSPDGLASITFFEDSIARIEGGTNLQLARLDASAFAVGKSEVLIDLENGRIWSKIQKQTDPDMAFSVQTTYVNAGIRGTVLDISSDADGNSIILVPEHTVEVRSLDPYSRDVIEGLELIEGSRYVFGSRGEPLSERILPDEMESDWYRGNLKNDEEYETVLRNDLGKRREEYAGALPGSFGYEVKKIQDRIDLLTAGEGKVKKTLDIFGRELIEAAILFEKGEIELANRFLREAKSEILDMSGEKGEEISQEISDVLQSTEQLMKLTLPNEDDYVVKNLIWDLKIETAPEDERDRLQEWKVGKRIIDLYDLSKVGTEEEMRSALEVFRDEMLKGADEDNTYLDLLPVILVDPYFGSALDASGEREKMESEFGEVMIDYDTGEADEETGEDTPERGPEDMSEPESEGDFTEEFLACEKPDIKNDYCGVYIDFQYCKCAFHGEYCGDIGMNTEEANTYLNAEYEKYADEVCAEEKTTCEAKADSIWDPERDGCVTMVPPPSADEDPGGMEVVPENMDNLELLDTEYNPEETRGATGDSIELLGVASESVEK